MLGLHLWLLEEEGENGGKWRGCLGCRWPQSGKARARARRYTRAQAEGPTNWDAIALSRCCPSWTPGTFIFFKVGILLLVGRPGWWRQQL